MYIHPNELTVISRDRFTHFSCYWFHPPVDSGLGFLASELAVPREHPSPTSRHGTCQSYLMMKANQLYTGITYNK